ncbi:hypothetical protein [Saccharopolyspora shandongensis]|uniref:hypothetical protein n=1 Tax=Saccharopolyspora shandongensis TaxID=418495 RepID=UPI0033EBE799
MLDTPETTSTHHFQHWFGLVPEWCRFAHIRCDTSDFHVISWCGQRYQINEVEECSRPGTATPGLAPAARECTDCEVQFAFRNVAEPPVRAEPPGIPARIDTPSQILSAVHLLRDGLDCETRQIPLGNLDTDRLGHLAGQVEIFARALRRFCWLAGTGERLNRS